MTAPAPDLDLVRREQVREWRVEMLQALGLSEDDADYLARVHNLDWHEAERLVTKGCPPELVLELLM